MILYSFIIPVKEINDYIRESVSKILEISRDDYEIIIYPNVQSQETWDKTRQIATGPVGPAEKRSLAIRDANGAILVFIDDDAYPQHDFLDKLDKIFLRNDVVAVGGPAITPPNDSFWQKVSGAVFLSKVSGGFPERYVPVGKEKVVDDWPTVNFSIRKQAFIDVGGFDCQYWPGEDTKLCIDVINKTGRKIVYAPDLIVFHHRRSGLLRHLKQIGGYGIHRGFFAKALSQTSLRVVYFIPSIFLLFVMTSIPVFLTGPLWLRHCYIGGYALYILALCKAMTDIVRHEKDVFVSVAAVLYIMPTHLWYGWRFIQGFVFTHRLKSALR